MTHLRNQPSNSRESLILRLVQKARQKDEKSFEKLSKLFEGYKVKYLQKLPISEAEKVSLFNSALLKAIHTWDPKKSRFSTWLYWKLRGEIYMCKRDIIVSSSTVSLENLSEEKDMLEEVYDNLEPLILEPSGFEEISDEELVLFILLLEYNFDIERVASRFNLERKKLVEVIETYIDELGISGD